MMSDALEKKHEILQRKYKNLRSNHRRLAGVALRLAEALEAFLKDNEKPDMNDILMSCSNMYPGLIEATEKAPAEEAPPDEKEMNPVLEDVDAEKKNEKAEEEEEVDDKKKDEEGTAEDDYYEGFWSRPKIPRTPQISSE